MKITDINSNAVIDINRSICAGSREPFGLIATGQVDSAVSTAFYPGVPPYQHGGLAGIAGAMAFYLAKAHAFRQGNKRTASAAALVFLEMNGYEVVYPGEALADVILAVTVDLMTMSELQLWFDTHKVRLD